MLTLPNYKIGSQIYESVNSLVYRGHRKKDNQPVILKMLKLDYPTPAELTRYRQEYEITHDLDLAGVIKAYSIEKYQNTLVIIFQDFGGESLKQLMANQTLTLKEFLPVAIQIADSLGNIHAANIIHKDINPSNIVVNIETKLLKIIDFGIASRLPRENPTLKNPEQLEGTLAYLSPEQTGRINRSLDYRTDLYSLGVTFYELLTGLVPFDATDAMELVHCHLAKTPAPVCEVNPDVPLVVSNIVLKLMAKNAENRYQSAFGLKADLEKCLENIIRFENIECLDFELAQNDFSGKLQIPQKLYGRENEVNTLLQAFERVSQGCAEMMLVAGYSGVGKTALVREVHKPMTSKRGYFVAGKFDQFQKNIPYSAISQAFKEFCRYLLMESAETLANWQTRILEAVGNNGQIIIDVIPDLELVIGPQPAVAEVGPTEAQNRFQIFFLNFIKVLSEKEHPFILFIDDLQWVDSASLGLLKSIMLDDEIQHLLIIGAYRDNEVDGSHPFIMAVFELQRANVNINSIELANLQQEDVNQLLQDSLSCETALTQPLTDLVYQKTQGNAFFTHQFLQTLYSDMLLHFDFEQLKWRWDVEQIATQNITANVVELMANKIDKLPSSTSAVLQLAACIGNQFDFSILAIIYEQDQNETLSVLHPAITEGLIQPLDENYKRHDTLVKSQFKFLHDRIQQAAYALIDDEQKQAVHLQIGRLLLKNTHADALEDKMFDIVNHLNLGRTLLQKKEEQEELVQLNLLASKKAKHSNAFGPALNYVLIGTELLIEDDWEIQYNLIYELFLERAICEHMVGNLEAAEELLRIVLKKARNKLDRAKVQTEMELLYLSQGRHQDVIDTILNTLEELGFEVPEQSNPDDILMTSKILRKKAFDMIGNRSIEELLYCSETTVPIAIEAHKHLYNLAPSSFFLNMNLYLWLGAQNLELAVRTGNTELASFNYSVCGLSLLVQGELNLAYKFAKLGVELSNKYQSNRMKGACYFHFCLINSWKNHFKSDVRYACLGYQFALDAGDYFFMTWSAYTHVRGLTLMGSPLKNIVEQVNRYVGLVKKINYENAAFLIASQRMALALMGKTRSNDSYDDDEFDESTFVQEVSAYENPALIFNYYIYKLQSLYILDKSAKAYVLLPKAEKFLSPQWVEITEYYFYYSLILADIYPRLDTDAQVKTMNILYENRQKMQDWATAGSENFQNRYLLVEAEIARISNENWQATTFYDRAILSARENEFIQNEAIANELAAKFWLGKEEIAQIYLRKAHYAYQQWGATAKVKALEARYPQLLTAPKILSSDVTITDTLMSTDVTRMQTSKALDLDSVTKAAQTLTSEIVLDKLLEKMMYIVIENAGAERGFLLLPQGEQWVIEAEGAIDKPKITTLHSLPAANYLPEAIFNYVARTHENVVLANARREGHYTEEPYIKTHQTQSVLCFPIIYQQQLRAILYFENNLTTAAFTPQRLKVLTMLSSQIAISLENAQVMANLDTKVKERTAQLNAKVEELTQTRHELVQSEKMASLGRLVAGFAHELNTPLGVAIGSASMLQRKAKKVNSLVEQEEVDVDELLAILKSIDKGSDLTLSNLERAANLVTSFKRTAIDQTSDKARSFHVHQVVNDTINTLQSQFKKTDIEISVDCPKALKVKSLPGALEQILTNLLMNSLIHGFNEGQNAGVIQINVQLSGEQLHLEYSDNGKGIASENLEKIFEPFFTTYRAHGGSGLGMYICYNVVTTQLHGTINCESTLGKGVIFRIDYPI